MAAKPQVAPPTAPTTVPAVPASLCTISPGWALVHQVEADASGNDKFTRQTCVVRTTPDPCSMFIPTGVVPTQNKVHIFFAANSVSGDVSNAVTCHVLRAAAADTDWILIAVAGKADPVTNASLPVTVTAAEVLDFLDHHGRPRRVDKLRLSCHSRGKAGLVASLASGNLVASSPTAPVFAGSIVERVLTFDADEGNALTPAVARAGISAGNLFGYQVIARDWHISQTIKIADGPCLRGVVYCRLIEDAVALRGSSLTVPADIQRMVTDLGLPKLGLLTSRKTPTAPMQNYWDFCASKRSVVTSRGFDVNKLGSFVSAHDLARLGITYNNPHHFFVAEFAHEATDTPPPETHP